jgi:hypothetical protein
MHAQWTEDYIVNFYPLGGSPAPVRQFKANDGKADDPGAITVSGALFQDTVSTPSTLAFGGWYDNPEYNNSPWNFGSDDVTGNLNLYAKWTVDTTKTAIDVSGQSGANFLDKTLNYIAAKTLSSSTDYTIVLADSTYTQPGIPLNPDNPGAVKANITNANAVITLMGTAATDISLSSNGALFVISAGELVLDKNITLTGHSANNSSLVIVFGSAASLTMKADAKITGNTNTSSIPGGGVFVYGGAFAMSGTAKISGNNAASEGGGVAVYEGGSLAMTGGEISGNASSYSGGEGGGGGVALHDSAFTMSGTAKISGNTTGGDSATGLGEGGGVGLHHSTFTMSGGEISGNSTTGYDGGGGGVAVTHDSTFTMQTGAKISGNFTALVVTACGGGVIVNHDGVFTMEGGEISGNYVTAGSEGGSGEGGGVAIVNNSSFIKTGGVLYGNDSAATDNIAPGIGKAVWYVPGDPDFSNTSYYRNTKLDTGNSVNTSTDTFPTGSGQTTGYWTKG